MCIVFLILLFSYQEFYRGQEAIVQGYPDMVREELGRYDLSLCTFFGVDRVIPLVSSTNHDFVQKFVAHMYLCLIHTWVFCCCCCLLIWIFIFF